MGDKVCVLVDEGLEVLLALRLLLTVALGVLDGVALPEQVIVGVLLADLVGEAAACDVGASKAILTYPVPHNTNGI